MKEIIETAVPFNTFLNTESVNRSEADTADGTAGDDNKGIYMHNMTASSEDKWYPAIMVCSYFGFTLEDLKKELKRQDPQSDMKELDQLKEYTPVNMQQIRRLAEVRGQLKKKELR